MYVFRVKYLGTMLYYLKYAFTIVWHYRPEAVRVGHIRLTLLRHRKEWIGKIALSIIYNTGQLLPFPPVHHTHSGTLIPYGYKNTSTHTPTVHMHTI